MNAASVAPTQGARAVQGHNAHVEAIADVLHVAGHHVLLGGCNSPARIAAEALVRAKVRRSLVVVPTHACASNAAEHLRNQGLAARQFPRIDETSCRIWFTGPKGAEAAGLPVAATHCPHCPHRCGPTMCAYQSELIESKITAHLAVTACRAAFDHSEGLSNRDVFLFLSAHPADMLKPTRDVLLGVDDDYSGDATWASNSLKLLSKIACLIDQPIYLDPDSPVPNDSGFWNGVDSLIRTVNAALLAGDVSDIVLPSHSDSATTKTPREWAGELWAVLQGFSSRPRGDVTRMILTAATGGLQSLWVYPSVCLGIGAPNGTPRVASGGYLIGVSHLRRLPSNASAVDLCDHDPDYLQRSTQTNWQVVGNGSGPTGWARVTQIFQRVTACSSPARLLDRVRLLLCVYSGKVGVLAHRGLLKRLSKQMDVDGWPAADRDRIATAAWFGSGASSLSGCEIVIALGAPRPHRVAVFKRLLQAGDPAAYEEPLWDETTWQGTTADGQPVMVRGHGYLNDRWQAADYELAHEVLRRRLGDLSCPVIMLADDRLDVPLGGKDPGGLSADCRRVLRALAQELANQGTKAIATVTKAARAMPAEHLAKLVGLAARTVRRWLAQLEREHLVEHVSKAAGWTPVPCSGGLDHLPSACRRVLETLREQFKVADWGSDSVKTPITAHPLIITTNTDGIGVMKLSGVQSATSVPRLAQLTGLPTQKVRRHLSHLEKLGFAHRLGLGRRTQWTLTALVYPEAVAADPARSAYESVHGSEFSQSHRLGGYIQRELPFLAAAYAATLQTATTSPSTNGTTRTTTRRRCGRSVPASPAGVP